MFALITVPDTSYDTLVKAFFIDSIVFLSASKSSSPSSDEHSTKLSHTKYVNPILGGTS